MRGVTRRRIYFVFSLALLISLLGYIIWFFFLPELRESSLEPITEPVKEVIVAQIPFWILVGLLSLVVVAYIIDSIVSGQED